MIDEATKSYKEKGTLNTNLGFSRPISSVLAYLGFGAFVDKMDALAVTHPQTVRNFKIAMTIAIPAILGMAALKLPGLFLTTLCNVSTGLVASLGYEKLGVEKIEKSISNTTNKWKQKFQAVQEKSSIQETKTIEMRSSEIQ